ncbi:MAG TPA: hypothetical protein ENG47_04075 [Candidatus Aerophobetes bacterium]|uniref:Uncharacterized protein n=1 Tax=Aerophobetes bacterium TaxID=2030807 RepID=A0A7V0QR60_UNCAE|nr:hypothetical protein [Candidatus Aerophobetes bacterium]
MKVEKFWEVWENMSWTLNTLKFIVLLQFTVIIILGLAIVKKITQRKPVVIVPGAPKVMELQPDIIPEQTVKDLAIFITTLYASFSPASIQGHFEDILRFVDSESYGEVKSTLLAQIKKVKESGYSQHFDPDSVWVENDTVFVRGLLKAFIGNQKIKEEANVFKLKFKKGVPNSSNPYGIYLTAIRNK